MIAWLGRVALLAALAVVVLLPQSVQAQMVADESIWFEADGDGGARLHLYFFWSKSCPHCQAAHPWVESLPQTIPWLTLHSLELSENAENGETYVRMAASLGQRAQFVPAFLFCGNMITGFDSAATTGASVLSALTACHDRVVATLGAQTAVVDPVTPVRPTPAPLPAAAPPVPVEPAVALTVPLLGEIAPAALSLPALTFVIAGLDAFNPCAFFVLMFLLSLMVHARDRRRMLLIGATFVFFSGLIYFIFMAAWLNLFVYVGELQQITLAAGLVAVVIAVINIKDYFWFKQGISLSIPEAAKPGLYQRSRNLLKASTLPAMLAGTVILALAANSYELLCTAGFPMVYSRILTLNQLPAAAFYAYLAAYNVIYVIPLLLIVILFTVKFGQRRLSEEQGRVLKLLSGLMMLLLGVLLVAAPELLNQVTTALLLLATTLALTALVVWLDRRAHRKSRPSSSPRRAHV